MEQNKIKEIQDELNETIEVLNELDVHLDKTFLIEGKTRREWRRKLLVNLPEDEITFADVIKLSIKIANNYQTAAFHRDNQALTIDTLSRSKEVRYNQAYQEILNNYIRETGKSLAASSCAIKASSAVQELDSAISAKKILKDFWAKTCETLVETRKNLETIAYALSGEIRAGRDFVVKIDKEQRK